MPFARAVEILRAGGLVAFPTETVYGLGADAMNATAIRRIFAAKERPYDHPLIVHIAELSQLSDWAMNIAPSALHLAEHFWPGPLTIILKKQPKVLDIVTGHQETVGIRMPRHPIARELLRGFGGGIAAPSANRFTHVSPTTASAVYEELTGRVDLILDGGMCEVGLESTIIDMSGDAPQILRPGMITKTEIEVVLGQPVTMRKATTIRAPGMHPVHYAPVTPVAIVVHDALPSFIQQLKDEPIAFMRYQANVAEQKNLYVITMPTEAEKYAQVLYDTLRTWDHGQVKQIVVEAIPESAEWAAIWDRLMKASRSS